MLRARAACVLVALLALGSGQGARAQAAGAPLYGRWGVDTAGMDSRVRPGDDFFAYANGTWLANSPIAPDRASRMLRGEISDRTEQRMHEIFEAAGARVTHAPRDLSGKIGAFYKSFMDEATVERLGARAVKAELDSVRQVHSPKALAALMGRASTDFEESLFDLSVNVDYHDPARYALYIEQAGLGLPDRDYYLEARFARAKAAYQDYVAALLKLAGWPQAEAAARDVVDFETHVAQASWTRVQSRDIDATYNPRSLAELQALAPDFSWADLLAQAGLGKIDRVIVAQPSAFSGIAAVFAQTPVAVLQAWQAFHVLDHAAPFLSAPFSQAWFDLHGKTLAGRQADAPRWQRAVRAISGNTNAHHDYFGTFGTMRWGAGELFCAQYFPATAKAKIEALVANMLKAFHARVERLDWMGPQTKAEALHKLDTFVVKVGYPERWRDYGSLVVKDDDLAGNVRRAAAADWRFELARLAGPVDRGEWVMTPQANNAYNGDVRDIVFPAGILQPPIFDPEADAAVNYGAIGQVIGHELTHGFDDEGRKIDATGALRDWWTAEDAAKFEARAQALATQYSAFQPVPSDPAVHVNGRLTLGENIADLGGLAIALDAYRASLGGAPAPLLDGFTGEQRVFLGYAQAWRGKSTDDALRQQVVSDPHAPPKFRVQGVVRNIDAWYDDFAVQPTDALSLAPQARVRIW